MSVRTRLLIVAAGLVTLVLPALAQQGVTGVGWQLIHPRLELVRDADREGLRQLLGKSGFDGSHAPGRCEKHTGSEVRVSGGLEGLPPGQAVETPVRARVGW